MWPTIPRSEERPSRPPSGLRAPTPVRHGALSSRPQSAKSNYEDEDDDASSCDDTYVSMTSSRSRIIRNSSSKYGDSQRILKETSRVSNKSRSRSSSTFKGRGNFPDDEYGENASTVGILNKLKNDIESIEQLRKKTERDEFSTTRGIQRAGADWKLERTGDRDRSNDFSRVPDRGNSRTQSSMRARNSHTDFSSFDNDASRSRSVGRFFREKDLGESVSDVAPSAAKSPPIGTRSRVASSPWQKRKEKAMGGESERLQILEHENERLQETVRTLKTDSIKTIERNGTKMSDVKLQLEKSRLNEDELERALRELISNVENDGDFKLKLEKSQSKEFELENILRELVSNVQSEQEMMSDELKTARKLRESEVALLEGKLRAAHDELGTNSDTIHELESETERLRLTLKEDKEETESQLCQEIESVKSSMKSNETSWGEKVKRLNKELEHSRSTYQLLEERLRQVSEQLNSAESRCIVLKENAQKSEKESHEAMEAAKKSLQDVQKENQAFAEKLGNAMRDNARLLKAADDNNEALVKLEASLAQETEKYNNTKEAVGKLEAENGDLKKTMDYKHNAISELELALAEANISKVNLELQVNSIKSTLETEVHELKEEKEESMQQLSTLQYKVSSLEEERKAQAGKIDELSGAILKSKSCHEEEINDLRKTLQERENALGSLKATFEQGKTRELNEQKELSESKMRKLEDEKEAVMTKAKMLEENMATSDKQRQDQVGRIEELQKAISESNAKHGQSEAVLKASMEETDELKEKLSSAKKELSEVKSLKSDLGRVKADLGESVTKSSIMESEIASLQSELLSATERLQVSNDGYDSLKKASEDMESKLKDKVKTLTSQLSNAKKSMEKVKREAKARNGQLKSALHSLDEMMKYIESMRVENDEVVASLEVDLEKAIKMKQHVEMETKKRIDSLEQNDRRQREVVNAETESKKKLLKDLEACRIDAIKEVSKAKDGHALKVANLKRAHLSEIGSLTNKMTTLKEEIEGLQKMLGEEQTTKAKLLAQKASLEATVEALEKRKKDNAVSIEKLEKMVEETTAKMTGELAMEKDSYEDRVKSLVKSLDEAKRSCKNESISNIELRRELEELRERCTSDEKIKRELEMSLQGKSTEYVGQIRDLKALLKQKSMDSDSLRQKIKTLEARINTLSNDNQEEAKRIRDKESDWSKQAEEYEDKLSKASTKMESASSKSSALEKEVSQLTAKLRHAEREKSNLNDLLGKAKTAKSAEQEELGKMLEKKIGNERALRGELAQKKQMIAILQSNERHLEEHVSALEEQINKLVSEYETKLQSDNILACD